MDAPYSAPDPRRFEAPPQHDAYRNGPDPSRSTGPQAQAGGRPAGPPPNPSRATSPQAKGRRLRPQPHAHELLFPDAVDGPASHENGASATHPPVEVREATVEEATLLRGALQSSLSPETFLTWFTRSRLVAHEGHVAVIAVPNGFARDWIERYYLDVLHNCAVAVLGPGRTVVVRDAPEALVSNAAPAPTDGPSNESATRNDGRGDAQPERAPSAPHGGHRLPPPGSTATRQQAQPPHVPDARDRRQDSEPDSGQRSPAARAARARIEQQRQGRTLDGRHLALGRLHHGSDFVLNPKCTFDSFVVGPCNRFGHAAAIGASEQPGKSYNPLFLHGRVGVGKTHLLQAFCYAILENHPESRILYLSCETFVNHFIDALENGNTQDFREKYRNIDVLVVDDVQVLANKEKTQEEFFHTFNTLYNAGKQIVLSSDSPPKDIPTLQDRLVSRFKWGMVTELEPPCLETRMAIVKRKARERSVEIPDDVVEFIAENIEENVREIEGAVTRLLGYTALSNSKITLELARTTLSGLIEVRRSAPTIDNIVSIVTEHFQVKLSELQSKKRTKAIAFPRQVAMYLARKLTRHSLEDVGGFFGGRDHTTVMYAVDKITEQQTVDPELARALQGFVEQLAGRP